MCELHSTRHVSGESFDTTSEQSTCAPLQVTQHPKMGTNWQLIKCAPLQVSWLTDQEIAHLATFFSPQTLETLSLTHFGISYAEARTMRQNNIGNSHGYKVDLLINYRNKISVGFHARKVRNTLRLPSSSSGELNLEGGPYIYLTSHFGTKSIAYVFF